jgi:hypothetical protein
MKKFFTLVTLITAVVAVSTTANAQTAGASSTSPTSITVVAPIEISNTVEMTFGNVAVNGNGGSVTLTPAGEATATGNVKLTEKGLSAAAVFAVQGEPDYNYAITLPDTFTLTSGELSILPTLSTFTTSGETTKLSSDLGKATFNVGALLTLPTGIVAATYTNTTNFIVTVNYL